MSSLTKTNTCSSTNAADNNFNLKISPCKECQNRYVGCHGECDFYISWRDKKSERSMQIYNNRKKDSEIRNYEVSKSKILKKKYSKN